MVILERLTQHFRTKRRYKNGATAITGSANILGHTTGYVSAAAKEKYNKSLIVAGVAVVGSQIILPVIVIAAVIVVNFAPSILTGHGTETHENVYWKDPMVILVSAILFLVIVVMLSPLVLAVALARPMAKYRIAKICARDVTASFATISRRAAAQIIDCAMIIALLFETFRILMAGLGAFEKEVSGFILFHLLIPVFLVAYFFIHIVVFAFMEGRWGFTPGKWILGIRVLKVDLKPCGFPRALLRNLLRLVDMQYNGIVGIASIALSERWQRIGDLAAKTVVVRVKKSVRDEHP